MKHNGDHNLNVVMNAIGQLSFVFDALKKLTEDIYAGTVTCKTKDGVTIVGQIDWEHYINASVPLGRMADDALSADDTMSEPVIFGG